MELTDNDKHRIHKEVQRMLEDGVDNVKRGLFDIAEYATIFERQQQAIPKFCGYCGGNGFTLGYENTHVNCKHCQGTGEDNECPSLPECYAASKKLDVLEAERTDLLAKVSEQEKEILRLRAENEHMKNILKRYADNE